MRLIVDCRYVAVKGQNGISRYTVGLVRALVPLHPFTMLISDERQLAALPDAPWIRVSAPTSIREPLVAWQVRRLEPDIVFSPMQTMGSWGRSLRPNLTLKAAAGGEYSRITAEGRSAARSATGSRRS